MLLMLLILVKFRFDLRRGESDLTMVSANGLPLRLIVIAHVLLSALQSVHIIACVLFQRRISILLQVFLALDLRQRHPVSTVLSWHSSPFDLGKDWVVVRK